MRSSFLRRPWFNYVWLIALLMPVLAACSDGSPTTQPSPTATTSVQSTITPLPLSVQPTIATPPAPTPALTLPPQPTGSTPQPTPPVATDATPPTQPATGPGGAEKKYGQVKTYSYGQDEHGFYIFEPANPTPTEPLPVVIFLHGYAGLNLHDYQPWLDHLVQRGNLVIFPLYQTLASADGAQYTDNAAQAVREALGKTKVKPDLKRVVMIGYSAGGVIAANLTAQAAKRDLPAPKSLFLVSPGGCSNCSILALRDFLLAQPAELAAIPKETRLLLVVGDRDTIVGRTAADLVWQGTAQLSADHRDYLQVQTDAHGIPSLVADHGMATHFPPNALNYLGIWKLADALESCTLAKQDCEYAFGGTPQQLAMGKWSDGTPVQPLKRLNSGS